MNTFFWPRLIIFKMYNSPLTLELVKTLYILKRGIISIMIILELLFINVCINTRHVSAFSKSEW